MTKKHVLMIDNYDSFTWNLYQYLLESELCLKVDVYRNDKIDVDTIENKIKPDLILISPGPGHPNTDLGISRDVVDHFKGKLPIFGVCMGQQCIFDVFGGDVSYAGEIVHGKTTSINHNGKGVFKDIPQGVAVTRYHSLAGTLKSLPDCLEVTARTDTAPEVIMGVRHKKYTIEGVQFHPESILTESGRLMIRNLLSVTGGTWDESEQEKAKEDKEGAVEKGAGAGSGTGSGAGSGAGSGVGEVFGKDHPLHPNHPVHPHNPKANILEIIYEKRRNDYKTIEQLPGKSFKDLEACVPLAPPVENFYRRLRNAKLEHKSTPVLAEFKRASPSKGVINRDANVVVQASIYALNNAAAISVLTEPNWFLGSLDDLTWARKAVDFIQATASDFQRPAILRKEFIFCKYQILEARLAGADSVLLIVKMLDNDTLQELYEYSMSLRMIPLVEVNNKQELDIAIQLTYKDHTKDPLVIGVNNRNLTTFDVDLATTGSLVHDAKHSGRKGDVLILALSGITSVEQVKKFKYEDHVDGFLVGESLMRAEENGNAGQFLHDMCKA